MFSDGVEQTHQDRIGEYSKIHHMQHVPHYGTYHPVNQDDTAPGSDGNASGSGDVPFPSLPGVAVAGHTKKKLGLAALVVLIYYEVSGGPFGIEDIVRAGGPLYAILGFSLFIVWVIPEALVTAELSTALPEASGAVGRSKFVVCLQDFNDAYFGYGCLLTMLQPGWTRHSGRSGRSKRAGCLG